jgi:parallel beta-helix repeat protein
MSKLQFAFIRAVIALAMLPARSWAVTNAVAGTCKAGTHFTTIQAAIKAATAGSTVLVCPGTYPEVLTIRKDLVLKGVASGTSASVGITPPAGGVPTNAVSSIFGNMAVQVLVQSTARVTITNVTIDGGAGATSCTSPIRPVEVLFQAAGGLMSNSAALNAPQCRGAIAAFADATTNFQFLNKTVLGVEVQQLDAQATISNNFLSGNLRTGIYVMSSPNVTLTGNTIAAMSGDTGIWLDGATANIVQNNHVSNASYGIVVNDNSATSGNTVTKNIIKSAGCGLGLGTLNGSISSPNTYFTTTQTVCNIV